MPQLPKIKHERLAQEILLNGGNFTQAYCKVYKKKNNKYTPQQVYKLLKRNPEIRDRVPELANLQGLDVVYLNDRLRKMCEAKRPFVNNNQIIEIDDNATQLEAVKQGYKLHGIGQNIAQQINVDNSVKSVNVTDIDLEKIKAIAEDLKRMKGIIDSDPNYCDGEIIEEDTSSLS